jgi:hypothetical protein
MAVLSQKRLIIHKEFVTLNKGTELKPPNDINL